MNRERGPMVRTLLKDTGDICEAQEPGGGGMSIQSVDNTARAMSYYLRLQEVTANNLSNMNTDAFKAVRLAARMLPGANAPEPVEQTDLRQGTFRETGRPLDVALDGPGFFVVQTGDGERLIRGGSFTLDSMGRLSDLHGNPVMGLEGPLVLQGAEVEIEGDGTILVDGSRAGRLRIQSVEDTASLRKEAAGRFVPMTALSPASTETRVRQGAVEDPNFDPLLSMVDLITIQRAYAANVDALKAVDGVLHTIAGEVGRV
jgi:flagellar basal-body rod protein FlgF